MERNFAGVHDIRAFQVIAYWLRIRMTNVVKYLAVQDLFQRQHPAQYQEVIAQHLVQASLR